MIRAEIPVNNAGCKYLPLTVRAQTSPCISTAGQSWTQFGSTRRSGRVGLGRVKKFEYFYSRFSQIAKFFTDSKTVM
jgi:hypothetical protein